MGAMARPAARRAAALAALGLGAVWWWAVLRLLLSGDAGVLEGAVAAGGWGLSVLPVHCVPKDRIPKDRVPKDCAAKDPGPEGCACGDRVPGDTVPGDEARDH